MLGLQWDDLDLANETLTVRRALQRLNGKLTLTEPKSEASSRTLALLAVLVTMLKALQRLQHADEAQPEDPEPRQEARHRQLVRVDADSFGLAQPLPLRPRAECGCTVVLVGDVMVFISCSLLRLVHFNATYSRFRLI